MAEEKKDKAVHELEGEALVEWFAERTHAMWAHWMKYQFDQADWRCDERADIKYRLGAEKITHLEINGRQAERWFRQMNTPYDKLSEEEKKSNRGVFYEHIFGVVLYDEIKATVEKFYQEFVTKEATMATDDNVPTCKCGKTPRTPEYPHKLFRLVEAEPLPDWNFDEVVSSVSLEQPSKEEMRRESFRFALELACKQTADFDKVIEMTKRMVAAEDEYAVIPE